jgi:hypothetical protein
MTYVILVVYKIQTDSEGLCNKVMKYDFVQISPNIYKNNIGTL